MTTRHPGDTVIPVESQLTFEDAAPAQRRSATSTAAAKAIQPHRATTSMKVHAAIASWGPITDEEIAIRLEMNPSTVRPRRVELVKAGKVYQQGNKDTASGRRAAAWVSR